jgi:hypothetical protein
MQGKVVTLWWSEKSCPALERWGSFPRANGFFASGLAATDAAQVGLLYLDIELSNWKSLQNHY